MEAKEREMGTLEVLRKVAKQDDTEKAFLFGYLQGLEAAALVLKPETQKTA
jgi:hypothetical protein